MKAINRISAASLLAAASLTFSSAAWSLGLGDATVQSFLNQPLQVRIDLLTRETDDLASVTARLASADDYELIGANREAISVPIRFSVEDLEGDAFIVASSSLPVADPVVRLIVEVNWSSGRLLREYTLFLDPPTYIEAPPLPVIDQRSSAPAPAPAPVETPAPEPAERPAPESAAAPAPTTPAARTVPASGEYGPVQNGETLWGIASRWSRGSGMDINKVMIAIQRENPDAFLNDNINLLKRGAILRLPAMSDVAEIPTAAAINEVEAQTDRFVGRKAAASPETPLLAEEAAPEAALAPAVEETADPADTETDSAVEAALAAEPASSDLLELVPPSESDLDSTYGFEEAESDGVQSASALRENLARAEEELINQQQQNTYLQERIQELESQVAESDQSNAADADLARLEAQLREERQAREAAEAAARAAREEAQPWYVQYGFWLMGLLVLIALFAGWLFSRRGGGDQVVSDLGPGDEALREIQDEAEEVLRVLDDESEADSEAGEDEAPGDEPVAAEPETEPETESEAEPETESEAEPETETEPAEAEEKPGKGYADRDDDDAELLDEESSDPEIQLDLARAYISMGDKEAARAILEEVQANGSEAQQSEAEKMLGLLDS